MCKTTRCVSVVLVWWLWCAKFASVQTSTGTKKFVILNKESHTFPFSDISPDTFFHVKKAVLPFYAMGSTDIEVCTENISVFDLEFHSDFKSDNFEDTSPSWIILLKNFLSWSQPFFIKQTKSKCRKAFGMSPYVDKYFKIKFSQTTEDNHVQILIRHRMLDMKCCICLALGLLLFLKAPYLSKSVTFYYTSSTAVGILASALVLIFIVSRLIPKKPIAYTFLVGGSTLCVSVFSLIWENLLEYISSYYVAAYVLIAGFLTFAYCYYRGPVENPRIHNVIQWAIQASALILIYNGTQIPKASVTIIALLLLYQITSLLPLNKNSFCKIIYKVPLSSVVLGPQYKPRKLLTATEYEEQSRIETVKALEELRKFCNSPECSPWKTMSRLETPKRFARFIEGESHISAQEITTYEEDMTGIFEDNPVTSDFISEDDDSLDFIDTPIPQEKFH